ncbi:hypothetical protein LO762_00405 [Actinocorallia sp. API 0066]|nr:hypothetical protein [Actinocorallia sp. API 0066]MCD0447664.1 hypothetical protein [Actinocorallia sp. API 0066]
MSPKKPEASAPDLTLAELDALPDVEDPLGFPEFGGWGLPLVQALADVTGAHWLDPVPESGKWVWARFDFPPQVTGA